MGKFFKVTLICAAVFAILVACCSMAVRYDERMTETRGYGLFFMGRPAAPYHRAVRVLDQVDEFYRRYWHENAGALPTAKELVANIPDLMLDANQPYRSYEIYVLRTVKTNQWFLYSSEISSEVFTEDDFEGRGISTKRALSFPLVMCAMARREVAPGQYRPYNEYPPALVRIIGERAWRTWYFLTTIGLTSPVESKMPAVPGCVALSYPSRPERNKFYYPENVLPQLRAIYPNVRGTEGRDPNEGKAGTAGDPR